MMFYHNVPTRHSVTGKMSCQSLPPHANCDVKHVMVVKTLDGHFTDLFIGFVSGYRYVYLFRFELVMLTRVNTVDIPTNWGTSPNIPDSHHKHVYDVNPSVNMCEPERLSATKKLTYYRNVEIQTRDGSLHTTVSRTDKMCASFVTCKSGQE